MIRVPTRADKRIAIVVFAVALVALVAGGKTQGNTRDEGYYFDAAELYVVVVRRPRREHAAPAPAAQLHPRRRRQGFGYNHEHPALMKSLFGLSWRLLHRCHCPEQAGRHPLAYAHKHRTLGLLDEEAALRLPTDVLCALMAMLVYLLGAAAWSRAAGLVAATLAPRRAAPLLRRAARRLRRADRGDVGRRRLRLLARARRAQVGAGAPASSSASRSPPSTTPSSYRRCWLPHWLFVAWQRRAPAAAAPVRLHGDARRRRLSRLLAVAVVRHRAPLQRVRRLPRAPRLLQHGVFRAEL